MMMFISRCLSSVMVSACILYYLVSHHLYCVVMFFIVFVILPLWVSFWLICWFNLAGSNNMSSATTSSMPSCGSRTSVPVCYCGELVILQTAMTARNAGKKFWGCYNYKSGEVGCNYFEWVGQEVDGRDLIISRQNKKIQSMETELKSTRCV
ncbi:hypothetical protein Fmac_000978 [Flemingia macrophylla]|uniref:GRF-type domain-containing protein n=1 Tax=Flemingia macrophylla TaxID=520843 RepID=A0ABD1NFS4_9FABA